MARGKITKPDPDYPEPIPIGARTGKGILGAPDAEARMDRLVRGIRDGLYIEDACKLAGI